VPPPCGQRTGKLDKMYAAVVCIGLMRVWANKKKDLIASYSLSSSPRATRYRPAAGILIDAVLVANEE